MSIYRADQDETLPLDACANYYRNVYGDCSGPIMFDEYRRRSYCEACYNGESRVAQDDAAGPCCLGYAYGSDHDRDCPHSL